jgi:hypothetical protein
MRLAWYAARATWRRSWRTTLLIALILVVAVAAGVVLLLLAGNLLASVPALLAARIVPAVTLRTE